MNQCHKRLLLLLIVMAGTPFTAQAQNPQADLNEIGTYHWRDGCTQDGKVCGRHMYRDGLALLSLTVKGVGVDVVLVDTGKVMLVAITVGNDTKQTLDLVPQLFSLTAMKSKPEELSFLAPDSAARKIGKGDDSREAWMKTAMALSKSRTTTETGLRAVKGSGPAAPDTEQSQARDRAEGASENQMIDEMALRASIVPPRSFVTGIVFFESDKEADKLLLRVPAGGYIFEFPFVRR